MSARRVAGPPIAVALVVAALSLGAFSPAAGRQEAKLLNVVSAELWDLDASGGASPGDEVVLKLRRPLAPDRTLGLEDLPLVSAGDRWGAGARCRFASPERRGLIHVVLGQQPVLRLYETYLPGTTGRTVAQIRSVSGAVPILVRASDRKSFVGDRFLDSPELRPFYGQLHAHTGLSDGELEPADAFRLARGWGLDFFAVTDHLEQLTPESWERSRAAADLANAPGSFVALSGYEWGGFPTPQGWMNHVNVLGTDRLLSVTGTLSLRALYEALLALPGSNLIGQYNHPGMQKPVIGRNNWNDFEYHADADLRMKLITLDTAWPSGEDNRETAGLIPALDKGWHLAPKAEEDNHHADWGRSARRTGVWILELTRQDLLSGLLAMATFYTDDRDVSLKLRADGQWLMGSTLYGDGPHMLEVEVGHRSRRATVKRIEIVSRGAVVASRAGGTTPLRVTFDVNPPSDTYFFARAVLQDENARLISAPIFVDR